MTYSQIEQDLWVIKTTNYKKNGYFLDIGAYDGIHFSNSYLLETEHDWTGLLVEANPNNFELLKNNRPNSQNVMVAVSDYCGFIKINDISMSIKIVLENTNKSYNIESTTFQELFIKYNVPQIIDYMSLDIEGYESKALSKFPFDKYVCNLITVEHNMYLTGSKNKYDIQNILLNNNYYIVKENIEHNNNPFEDWYAHKSFINN